MAVIIDITARLARRQRERAESRELATGFKKAVDDVTSRLNSTRCAVCTQPVEHRECIAWTPGQLGVVRHMRCVFDT